MYVLLLMVLTQVDGGETRSPAATLIAQTTSDEWIQQTLHDGQHVRFGTQEQGPVHVWWPPHYKPQTALTVIYIHGYNDHADSAFFNHRLSEQFRDSGRNALFIVPEAPSGRADDVFWEDLPALIDQAVSRAQVKRANGPIWVFAHSGAYRTVVTWLKFPKVERVILLDGLYAYDDEFNDWVRARSPTGRPHRLTLIGFETAIRSQNFLQAHPDAVKLDDVPYLFDPLKSQQANASILYMSGERFGHMELITSGRVLPVLLHGLK